MPVQVLIVGVNVLQFRITYLLITYLGAIELIFIPTFSEEITLKEGACAEPYCTNFYLFFFIFSVIMFIRILDGPSNLQLEMRSVKYMYTSL